LHPGGVNVTLLDGSVRFIKSTISPPTWWALATKSGGEVVSADSF
jgi:prepilin-type processing-associated H-X9-DG protein